jgi:hypothetical protein
MFLNRAEYMLTDDPSFNTTIQSLIAPMPTMLHLPTPSEKKALELEPDGAAYGKATVELMFGRMLLAPPTNPVDKLIETALDVKQTSLAVVESKRGDSVMQIRANARMVLKQLDEKPKHPHMREAEWNNLIMIILGYPLPSTITDLTLTTLIPPGARGVRVLHGLENLTRLVLPYCDITDATLEGLMPDLVHMPRLTLLDLTRNSLTSSADLVPLATRMQSLETLLLKQNKSMGGHSFTGLFHSLMEMGKHATIKTIDMSYNDFDGEGLTFIYIAGWKTPDATLILPNIFDEETVAGIESLMPDGSTLRLEGVNMDHGSGWARSNVFDKLFIGDEDGDW